jgi:hypothetical protein
MWKEWRDQRVQVVGYALLVPVLLAIALLSVPGEWARMDAMPTFVALGGLLTGALTIASDLVPGELRRGRLDFLARLPCDLRAPFVAKTLFCALALAGFCLYAWFCATTLSAALAGGRWFAPFEWIFQYQVQNAHESHLVSWSMLDPLIVLSAWIFAVSCWLPRGTLALPAAAIVLALIGAPTALILLQHRGMTIHMEEMSALRVWLPATALLAAALSFLRGSRHGRAPLRMAGWTLFGTLFAAAPVWAWTANRWHDYVALDLESDQIAIDPIAIGDGGCFVFANVRPCTLRYGAVVEVEAIHPIIIDLTSGTAHEAAARDFYFELPWRQASIGTVPLALLGGGSDTTDTRAWAWGPVEWVDGFDGRTGTRLDGEQWKSLLQGKGALGDSIVRARDSIVLPDGTRCWMTGRTLHLEPRDGTATTTEFKEAPASVPYWRRCGVGFQSAWYDGFVDVAKRRFVSGATVRAITSRAFDGTETGYVGGVVAIRADGWLMSLIRGGRNNERDYALWSPGETSVRPVPGLDSQDQVVGAFTDGRVLVFGRPDRTAKIWREEFAIFDPSTGTRVPVALPAGVGAPDSISMRDGHLASGAIVCGLQSLNAPRHPLEARMRVVRIDLAGHALTTSILPSVESGDVIGCPDEETVIVLSEHRKILRARFDGSPYEVVFPHPEAHR